MSYNKIYKDNIVSGASIRDGKGNRIDTMYLSKDEFNIFNPAKTDLSNLSDIGEKHFLNKSQLTNCLLEVPQRIKVEAISTTNELILKAGSIVSVSENGTFEDVIITEDVSEGSTGLFTEDGNRDLFIAYIPSVNKLITFPVNHTFSQATAPTTDVMLISLYAGWFDTTTNTMKYTYDGGTTWTICSLPFTKGNPVMSTGWANHIKQIFNGFGYVGSTVWVDKGVKGLIPNGRNEDGSLKNIEFTTDKLKTVTNSLNLSQPLWYIVDGLLELYNLSTDYWVYDEQENYYVNSEKQKGYFTVIAQSDTTNGIISNFQPKLSFRAVDYNYVEEQLANKADITTPSIQAPYIKSTYVNGTSGYRIWSDGYCEQWGYIQASSSTDWENVKVTFLKTFANTNYNLVGTVLSSERSGGGEFAYHGVGYDKSTTGFYSAFPSSNYLKGKSWRAFGYLANGQY